MGGGVAPSIVPFSNLACALRVFAGKSVDQGRLADTRRAEKHGGATGPQIRKQAFETTLFFAAGEKDRNPSSDSSHLCSTRLALVRQISLIEQNHRLGAALPGHDEETLEATQTEIFVQSHDHEDRVQIGSHNLFGSPGASHLTGQAARSRQDLADQSTLLAGCRWPEEHPIPYRW